MDAWEDSERWCVLRDHLTRSLIAALEEKRRRVLGIKDGKPHVACGDHACTLCFDAWSAKPDYPYRQHEHPGGDDINAGLHTGRKGHDGIAVHAHDGAGVAHFDRR